MDSIKRNVEAEENLGLLTVEEKVHVEKCNKRSLFQKVVIGLSVLSSIIFIIYISIILSFKEKVYELRNLPDFGLINCHANLPYHSLQTFKFDPKIQPRFSYNHYGAEYSASDVKFANHDDSPNIKVLYDIKASDKYTLDNIKISSRRGYRHDYNFNVNAPKSKLLFRHCISLNLTVSFPKGLAYYDVISLNLSKPKLLAFSNQTVNQLSVYSKDKLILHGAKANHLKLIAPSYLYADNLQVNSGSILSHRGSVRIENVKSFEFNYNATGDMPKFLRYGYGYNRPIYNDENRKPHIHISGYKSIHAGYINYNNLRLSSDGSTFAHNINSKLVTVISKNSLDIEGSIAHLEASNLFNDLNVTVTDSNYISVYNNDNINVHVKSLGDLATTATPTFRGHANFTYKDGRKPEVYKGKGYFFEVASLKRNVNLDLPAAYKGVFEVLTSKSGKAKVHSNLVQKNVHYGESEYSSKKGYFGYNEVTTNKVKLQSTGCHAHATLNFH